MHNYRGPKTQESIQQHITNINFQHHISVTILAGLRGKRLFWTLECAIVR